MYPHVTNRKFSGEPAVFKNWIISDLVISPMDLGRMIFRPVEETDGFDGGFAPMYYFLGDILRWLLTDSVTGRPSALKLLERPILSLRSGLNDITLLKFPYIS